MDVFDLETARRDLIAKRVAAGADTPIGHRCSNLIEQLEHYQKAALGGRRMTMATDGPDPTPCDEDIFRKGDVVYQADGISSNRMEGWVKKIAKDSGQPVDWHYVAGCAIVKTTGDQEAVAAAIEKHLPELAELRAATAAPWPTIQ